LRLLSMMAEKSLSGSYITIISHFAIRNSVFKSLVAAEKDKVFGG
jgi:hypothetical protein